MNARAPLAALLILSQSGCVTARLSCDERCALSGMHCEGITQGNTTGVAYHAAPGTFLNSNSHSSGVVCRRPSSESDEAGITELATSAQAKQADANQRNVIIAAIIGGGLLILGLLTYKPEPSHGYARP